MNIFQRAGRWLQGRDASPDNCWMPDMYGAWPTGSIPGNLTNYNSGMGTPRDQNAHTFYNYSRTISRWELENAYRTSWIAKRIVNLPANDMCREWRSYHIEDDDGTQVDALNEADKQLQIRKRCNQALKWSRLYGGALMFLGLDGEDAEEPLNVETIREGSLQWLMVLDRWHIGYEWSGNTIFDIANLQYGLPKYYTIAGTSQRWHNTRVIRFDGEELPLYMWLLNLRWADSVLQHVLATVQALEAAQRACLLSMQQGSLDIVSLPGMKELLAMNQNGMEQIQQRIRVFSDLKSVYRVAVKDSDEKFDRVAAALSGYDQLFLRYQDEVCGAAEIPHTVLYGESPKGLSATGEFDTRNYYDTIATKQESDLRPQLDYLDEVFVRSTLGVMPDKYTFDFNSLWQIDEDAQSQIELRKAQRDHIYMTDGALQPEMVSKQLLDDGTYSTLTEEDVELIESFNEPVESPDVPEPAEPGQQTPPGAQPIDKRNGTPVAISVSTRSTPVAP